jgi:hypothetical protein
MNSQPAFWLLRSIYVGGVLALAACFQGVPLQSSMPSDQSGGWDQTGVEKSFSLLTDILIPPNASLDVERSLILGDLDRWTGRIILNVGQPATRTFALYQTQMLNFGWEPVMSVQAKVSVLSFTRGERAATIQIEDRTPSGSKVAVTVAPRQSGTVSGTSDTPGAALAR